MSEAIGKDFTDMARRVSLIAPEEFAGAMVVVPPGDAEPIAFLTASPKPNLIQFWSAVKSLVETAYTEAMQSAMQQDPWARR